MLQKDKNQKFVLKQSKQKKRDNHRVSVQKCSKNVYSRGQNEIKQKLKQQFFVSNQSRWRINK
jgi:hypothetical protein